MEHIPPKRFVGILFFGLSVSARRRNDALAVGAKVKLSIIIWRIVSAFRVIAYLFSKEKAVSLCCRRKSSRLLSKFAA
jgi:hypothetical protein